MASESTPLLQTDDVARAREKLKHPAIRRGFTIILSCVVLFAVGVFLFFFATRSQSSDEDSSTPLNHTGASWWSSSVPSRSWPESSGLHFKDLEKIFLKTPNETLIEEWSKYYTSGPHLAGKNLSQALWTKARWEEFGIKNVEIKSYDVLLNYPVDHSLTLVEWKNNEKHKVVYEASLEEDVLKNDSTSGLEDRIPTFHGYSASGNVTASFVYVNYGTHWDFQDLVKQKISLTGKIAVAKYGKIFRGLKIKEAEELGMVGVVIYSDPGDDGEITEQEGYKPYPNGPARNPSSVQRGSAQFLSVAPGDPTTPGYPSKPGVPRADTSGSIPRIPSLPISYVDAIPILKALNGYGPKAASINEFWKGGGLKHEGIKYNIGPSPNNLTLTLFNEQDYQITPLWNVIGMVPGKLSDEVIVMGNHRDAWIAGGAADPNSGTATMMEVVRGIGSALEAGWKPLRTIVLASWDGEEYGLVGSTEWVEDYITWLKKNVVAYVNVDVGASGPHFRTSSAPLLDSTIIEALGSVLSPNQTVKGQTVRDVWDGKIATIGSGSDYTAFQDFAGIPCMDLGFAFGPDAPVYHYHSNYDSFDWMRTYGDPGFHYHATMAKIWGLVTAKLVDSPVIQFNATNYAIAMGRYVKSIEDKAKNATFSGDEVSLHQLRAAVGVLLKVSTKFDDKAGNLTAQLEAAKNWPWYKWWQRLQLYRSARKINVIYKTLERKFLYGDGLDHRSWFKHTIFAPGRYTGYAGATFPGLVESVEDKDIGNMYRWQGIISTQVYDVVALLQ